LRSRADLRTRPDSPFGLGKPGRVALRFKADLRPLKDYARNELPTDSILRAVIVTEPDELDPEVFLRKVPLWTKLLRRESKTKR